MANVAVLNMAGAQVGTIELNDAIFGIEANEHVMHLAVVQYLANQRQGTQSTKTRAEVRGGGRKPYRQKGTGRARAGSLRSPLFAGHPFPSVGWRWRCIRSQAQRLFLQAEQEGEKTGTAVRTFHKGCGRQNHRSG